MATPLVRYADVLAGISRGDFWSVYIDDTGPAGASSTPDTLPADRQTHVAAVFSPSAGQALMREMPGVLEELARIATSTEFHFTEIYNGKGPYREIAIRVRLALLEFFAEIAVAEGVIFIAQSIDSTASKNVIDGFAKSFPARTQVFDTRSPKDISLFLLLLKVRDLLLDREAMAAVFMDEGWKKNGVALSLPAPWDIAFRDGLVMSGRSHEIWGLQFADFGAFVLNRSQMLIGKEALTQIDLAFMSIVERISPLFDNLNTIRGSVEPVSEGRWRFKR